jgi:signal transduction histidine kinase
MYAYHKGIQIDKAEEIVKTTLKETEQMASMMNTLLQEYINNDKGKETIKVR